jgi:hypothetical protein
MLEEIERLQTDNMCVYLLEILVNKDTPMIKMHDSSVHFVI